MTIKPKLFLAVGIALLVLVGGSTTFVVLRLVFPYIDREISGPVTVNQQWLELTPKEPLTVYRDTQQIILYPIGLRSDMVNGRESLILPDGQTISVEVELVDSNGDTHRINGTEQKVNLDVLSTGFWFEGVSKDMTFKTVRVKSSAPLKLKKIVWRCYNSGEVPHK